MTTARGSGTLPPMRIGWIAFGLMVACDGSQVCDAPGGACIVGQLANVESDAGSACALPAQVLDAGADELSRALGADGYATEERRIELVFAASCARERACGASLTEADCLAGYEKRYRDWQGPSGRHVPCLDAYFDALGCVASQGSTQACEALHAKVDPICKAPPPSTPIGGDVCDPTLHSPPTKGRIPEEAINANGRGTDWSLVPDYVGAWSRDGSRIAGYVRKCDLATLVEDILVYDEALQKVIGHMVPGVGFVAL